MKITKTRIYPILVFIITLIVCFFSVKEGHQWGDDFAQYMSQAKAIALGSTDSFVKDNTFIVLNSPIEMATPVYPWGFPILLSLFFGLFGDNIVLYKIITSLLISLMSVLLYFFLDRYIERKEISLVFALGTGLNYYILKYVNNVTSDIIFLDICIYCYSVMSNFFKEELSIKELAIFGFVIGYSYITRSQGIALILGYLLCVLILAFKNKKMRMANLLPILGAVIIIGLDKLLLPHSERSSLYFLESMSISVFIENIKYYFMVMKELIPTPYSQQLYLYLISLIVVGFGIVKFMRKEDYHRMIYIILCSLMFIGINLLFPWHQGARYMLPVFPLYVLLIAFGLDVVLHAFKNKLIISSVEILLLFLLSVYGLYSYTFLNIVNKRNYDKGIMTKEALEMYEFIKNNTQEDDIFCFFKPRALYYMTDRLAYKPKEIDAKYLKDADYVIECNEDSYIDVSKFDEIMLEKVFENEKTTIYKIK